MRDNRSDFRSDAEYGVADFEPMTGRMRHARPFNVKGAASGQTIHQFPAPGAEVEIDVDQRTGAWTVSTH